MLTVKGGTTPARPLWSAMPSSPLWWVPRPAEVVRVVPPATHGAAATVRTPRHAADRTGLDSAHGRCHRHLAPGQAPPTTPTSPPAASTGLRPLPIWRVTSDG